MRIKDRIDSFRRAYFGEQIGLEAVSSPNLSGSIQPRFDPDQAIDTKTSVGTAFWYIQRFAQCADEAPPWGDPARDRYLREIWKQEPILAGSMYSMIAKMISLSWSLVGGKILVREYYDILQNADGGAGWSTFYAKACEDFFSTDRGMFVEMGKTEIGGSTCGLYAMDSTCCYNTGHPVWPVLYRSSLSGEAYLLRYDEVYRNASMPSADERRKGLGFCAVSRALRSAKLLMQLHKYKEEKLDNLPPEGIATITGMTEEQVNQAFALYAAQRAQNNQLTFPGILWLIGNDIGSEIKVAFVPFATLPENFNEQQAIEVYAKTLALSFGVDVGEFWQIEHSGATKASAWIQALKAKGKGPGEVSAIFARMMRTHVLPMSVKFEYESSDSEEERNQAQIKHWYARVIRVLSATQQQTGIISRDESRRLLAEWGVIPMDMVNVTDEYLTDIGEKGNEQIIKKSADGEETVLFDPGHRTFSISEVKHEIGVGEDGVVNIWLRNPEPVPQLGPGGVI